MLSFGNCTSFVRRYHNNVGGSIVNGGSIVKFADILELRSSMEYPFSLPNSNKRHLSVLESKPSAGYFIFLRFLKTGVMGNHLHF